MLTISQKGVPEKLFSKNSFQAFAYSLDTLQNQQFHYLGSLTNACCLLACCNGNTFERMGNTDDAFETLAFGVCNTDGIEGLSWDEVDQCEVSKHEYDFQSFNILALLKYAGPALICEGGLVCFSRFYWQFLA